MLPGIHRFAGTWIVLVLACGALLTLILLLGLATNRRAVMLVADVSTMNAKHKEGNRILHSLRANVHFSGVLVRDFLLDPSHLRAQAYRDQLVELRTSMEGQLAQLETVADESESAELKILHQELEAYWDSLDPLFDWTPQQKMSLSSFFLNRVVLPKKDAVLAITRDIEEIGYDRLQAQEAELAARQKQFTDFVFRFTSIGLLLGSLIAFFGALIIRRLERTARQERNRSEAAEALLRDLSRDLVVAQEKERKHLARELHDEVGQMLTALTMELRKAEKLTEPASSSMALHVAEAKRLAAIVLRSVRGIAMGLRPSMLDDLGLCEAVDWQLREFERRYGIVTSLLSEGSFDHLSDEIRTCIYRVVQEALTNCARHANASAVAVKLVRRESRLYVSVTDNGLGFDGSARIRGFGLVSMEERVRDLQGLLTVRALQPKGTELCAEIPVLGAL
jgi:signal transduction histidine kinase